jgi:hypothetical protein
MQKGQLHSIAENDALTLKMRTQAIFLAFKRLNWSATFTLFKPKVACVLSSPHICFSFSFLPSQKGNFDSMPLLSCWGHKKLLTICVYILGLRHFSSHNRPGT